MNLEEKIRSIPDFPKKGILFRDITTLLKSPEGFSEAINQIALLYENRRIELIVSIEARGFILGAALAYKLGVGFVPVRKLGKLPAETIEVKYELEYGFDTLQIHKDAILPGQKVLIIDDLLATGGTMVATKQLVEELKGEIIGFAFLIELTDLKGREKLKGYEVKALLSL
ncbi:MAG: adenine phosphoribosyltransferase [Armatimonadetes bacterium CG07_land_8_20_14_0_80_40_9]|nr:MAG: adenine phosphoribosyltransferase [Armatimonadetes bacterium CG07_land_8_20_14_0_80_40_9]